MHKKLSYKVLFSEVAQKKNYGRHVLVIDLRTKISLSHDISDNALIKTIGQLCFV